MRHLVIITGMILVVIVILALIYGQTIFFVKERSIREESTRPVTVDKTEQKAAASRTRDLSPALDPTM